MVIITPETKLSDILEEYPFIVDELPKIDKKFKILSSPIGKVMRNKVDVNEMSRRSGMSVEEIISMITKVIENH